MNRLLQVMSVATLIAVGQSTARAQRFDVQQLRPAMTQRSGTITLLHGETLGRDELDVGLVLNYADSPLVVRGENGGRFAEIVSQQLTGHVVGGFGVFGIGEMLIDVPFILHQDGDLVPVLPNLDSNASGAGFGVGDLRVAGKFGIFDSNTRTSPGGVAVSLYVQAQLPTGKSLYLQGGELRFTPGIAVDAIGSRGHRFTFNLAYTFRPAKSLLDELDVDDTVDFGVAATVPFTDWMRGIVELRGSLSILADDIGVEELPLEAALGLQVNNDWASLLLSGGVGLTSGFGTPDYRITLAAAYTGHSEPPRYDFDGDDIYDDVDQCPHEAEDRDGFEDRDGCPEREDDERPLPEPRLDPSPATPRTPSPTNRRRGRANGGGVLLL